MKKPKIYVTRQIPGDAVARLKKKYDVKVYPKDEKIPRKIMLKEVKDCDALLCILTEKIDRELIDLAPRLKVISNYAVGFNNIDVKYATKQGIVVCNTPSQEVVEAVAEHTFALLLAVAKRFHEDEEYVRGHHWKSWGPRLLLDRHVMGKTLGIVGTGRIGSGVVRRAQCFGVKVVYYDVVKNPELEKKFGVKRVTLNKLLKTADFISLHVPLLESTRHLIGPAQFKMMKNTSILVNTSRGPVVDEKALIKALKTGQIAGAGLDVFESEPGVNPQLTRLKNTILTPHTASGTIEVREQMSRDAANGIISVLSGKLPKKIVNKEVWKNRRK